MTNEELHALRKEIDAAIQVIIDEWLRVYGKMEIGLTSLPQLDELQALDQTKLKLKEAKMWVGKVLEARGSELPKEFRDKAGDEAEPCNHKWIKKIDDTMECSKCGKKVNNF